MASWLNESRFVRELADSILAAKKTHYQDDFIRKFSLNAGFQLKEHHHFHHQAFVVKNGYGQGLKASLFHSQGQDKKYCVLYLHGYGSHRLQGVTILNALPKTFALCCFDFSGSGKSQGTTSTYGIKEYEDISFLIDKLKQLGYEKVVLWGRSMGAVASLLYTSLNNDKNVIFQVLDSPFATFQNIAQSFAKKSLNFPNLFIGLGLNLLKQHLKQHKFDPFKIDLPKIVPKCKTPALFIYSQEDKIIPAENTQNILKTFNPSVRYEKLIISESHNSIRSSITLKNVMSVIDKEAIKNKSRIIELSENKKGLFEVFSSYRTPKAHKNLNFEQIGKIKCSLSQNKLEQQGILKISHVDSIRREVFSSKRRPRT